LDVLSFKTLKQTSVKLKGWNIDVINVISYAEEDVHQNVLYFTFEFQQFFNVIYIMNLVIKFRI